MLVAFAGYTVQKFPSSSRNRALPLCIEAGDDLTISVFSEESAG